MSSSDRRHALDADSYACRICLECDEHNMEKIYVKAEKIQFVTKLSVRDGDGLPAFICCQCKFELAVSHGFIQRSIASDNILRSRCQESRQGVSTDEPAASSTAPPASVCIAQLQAVAQPVFEVKTEPQEVNAGNTPETDPLHLGNEEIRPGTVLSTDQHFPCDRIISTMKPEFPQDPLQLLADAINLAGSYLPVAQGPPPTPNGIGDLPVQEDITGPSSYNTASPSPSSLDNKYLSGLKTESPTDPLQFVDNDNDEEFSNYYPGTESPDAPSEIIEAAAGENNVRRGNQGQISSAGAAVPDKAKSKPGKKLFSCNLCDASFKVRTYLNLHLRSHSLQDRVKSKLAERVRVDRQDDGKVNPKLYRCPICDKSFIREKNLTNHAQTHTSNPKPYQCPICDEYFMHTKDMTNHAKTHLTPVVVQVSRFNPQTRADHEHVETSKQPETKPDRGGFILKAEKRSSLTCDHCSESFEKRKHMVRHLQIHIERKYKCTECDEDFLSKGNLANHARCHAQKLPYECNKCKKEFADEIGLMAHEILTNHGRELSFDCAVCSKSLKSAKSLKLHMKKHKEISRYTCNDCKRRFPSKSILAVHFQVMHLMNGNTYLCPICMKKFRDGACLKAHLNYSLCRMYYSCRKCSRDFNTKEFYEKHLSVTHANDVAIYCEICKKINNKTKGKAFLSRINLMCHITKVHLPDKVKCNICKCKFKYQKAFGEHSLKCQNVEGSLTCSTCQRTYSTRSSLNRHMRSTHTDPKRFKCRRCFEGFVDVTSVEAHMATKQCTPVFPCPKCPKTFLRGKFLISHTSKCHKERTYYCYRCEKPFSDRPTMENHFYKAICNGAFKCNACSKSFANQDRLAIHIKKIHTEKQTREFPCFSCDKSFTTSQILERHTYRMHIYARNFICLKCGAKYVDAVSLDKHKMLQVCKARYKCEICSKVFINRSQMVKHHIVHSSTSNPFPCNLCNKLFKYKESLSRHRHSVHFSSLDTYVPSKNDSSQNVRSHLCDVCGMSYGTLTDLQLHIASHGFKKNHYTCGICGEEFTEKTTLSSHMQMHVEKKKRGKRKKELKFDCTQCGKRYYTRPAMLLHALIVHNDHRPFACDTCGWSFATKDQIIKHVNRHLKKRLTCDICEESYATKFTMIIHMRKHTGEKPFGCDLCSGTFVSNFALKMHGRVHGKIKRFECNVCKESFSTKISLVVHLHKHAEKQPFACEICTAGFREKADLVRHQRRLHLELFPSGIDLPAAEKLSFPCKICHKVFTSRNSLLKHNRKAHFKLVPEICEICGFAYLSQKELKDHAVSGHTIKLPHACKICAKTFVIPTLLTSHLQSYHRADFEEIAQ